MLPIIPACGPPSDSDSSSLQYLSTLEGTQENEEKNTLWIHDKLSQPKSQI